MRIDSTKLELLTGQQGLTFSELAKLAGMCRQNISTIKSRGTCTAKTACKLAAALGVDVEELLEVKDNG